MTDKYILEGQEPKKCSDLITWAEWMETANRLIALDKIDDSEISTIFLGLDYHFFPSKSPLLFETMVFGGKHNGLQERYYTYQEAEKGHQEIVELIKAENKK